MIPLLRASKLVFLMALVLIGTTALAGDPIKEVKQGYNDEENAPGVPTTDWRDGVHLIAGMGLNFATFQSDVKSDRLGFGSNLRSDIGYYFENGVGLELSGSVMFNQIPQGLIWTSGFMMGVRFAVPPILPIDNLVPYVRLFAGRSVNVVNYENHADAPFDTASRLQIQGTLSGFGIGHFQRGETGRVWYVELTVERHAHETIEAIADNAGVPIVIGSRTDNNHGVLYALCLTFGAVMF